MGKYAEKTPGKRRGFVMFMIVYAAVILGAAAVGLGQFWKYMEAYENSRINSTLDAYIEQLTPQHICDRSGDVIDSIDHNLQSEEDCKKAIVDFLSGGITYARKTSECTDTRTVYVLRSGGKTIGKVELVPWGEVRYGFTSWTISGDSFDLSFLIGDKETITVDHTMQVYAGETLLDQSYVTETGLKYGAVKDFYDELKLPYKLTYTAGPILGETVLRAVDAKGNPVEITGESDLDRYLNNCPDGVHRELDDFNRDFIHRYVKYLTSRKDNRQENYDQLIPLLKNGSSLKKRVDNAFSGLEFGQSKSDTVVGVNSNYIIDLRDGKYLCDVTYEVDSTGRDGKLHRTVNNARIFLVRTNSGLKAERLLSY